MNELIKKALRPIYSKIYAFPVNISSIYTRVPPLNQKIPNVVYQTWKRPVLALRHAREIKRFRGMNADYSFAFFDDDQMASYMNRHFSDHPILDVFNKLQIPASKADVWRYCILLKEGGIYCDIDSALSIPLRELLRENPSELISFEDAKWREGLDVVTYADPRVFSACPPDSVLAKLECPENPVLNWILCFEKGSPILEEVIGLIVRHAKFFNGKKFKNVVLAVSQFTGPLALTQAVWSFIQKTGRRPAQCGVNYAGNGIFRVPGQAYRHADSPYYAELSETVIFADH